MPKKITPIRYTDRDFESIKESLVQHAKRYYPDTFQDFSENSFGSLMIDTVSYVGDILSFYLDYQANESFLDTAIEYNNIIKLARSFGYKPEFTFSSYGSITLYVLVPSNTTGTGPDMNYAPLIKKGSIFSASGAGEYILEEDVDFSAPNVEIRVADVENTNGIPANFAFKAYGKVRSGRIVEQTIPIGEYERFLKIPLANRNISEVVEVVDEGGNEYFEVEHLAQDVIYRGVVNTGENRDHTPSILKPFSVKRRFVVEREGEQTFLQFGGGEDLEIDTKNVVRKDYLDPSQIVLKRQGERYIRDSSFDPTNLISSDEFGVSPVNTELIVRSRVEDINFIRTVGTVNNPIDVLYEFKDESIILPDLRTFVTSSLEVNNDEPLSNPYRVESIEEFKMRAFGFYSAQNRAVTAQDYQSLVYGMPGKFGSVARARVIRDPDSLKRNINIYVISKSIISGNFVQTNMETKTNIKTWLMKNKMISDTIDILDAKIINIGVEWTAIGREDVSKFDTREQGQQAVRDLFSRSADIGEAIFISDVYQALRSVDNIVDVTKVKVVAKKGGMYSDVRFNILENTSPDGRYINIPMNCVYEIKFPQGDIRGFIK
jgi:hypothetical protein